MSDFISGLPHLLCGWMQTGKYAISYLFNLASPLGLLETALTRSGLELIKKNLKALSWIFSIFLVLTSPQKYQVRGQ